MIRKSGNRIFEKTMRNEDDRCALPRKQCLLLDQLQRDRSTPARNLLRFRMGGCCTRMSLANHRIAQGFQFLVFNPAELEPKLENGHRQQLGGFGIAAG